jgi:hypothetical protein
MRQAEILKAITQVGDLGRDKRTSETILRFVSVDWIYFSSYQFLLKQLRRISQLYV